ncbi:unnamed protein product, partial [Eretmochelys imbricata]
MTLSGLKVYHEGKSDGGVEEVNLSVTLGHMQRQQIYELCTSFVLMCSGWTKRAYHSIDTGVHVGNEEFLHLERTQNIHSYSLKGKLNDADWLERGLGLVLGLSHALAHLASPDTEMKCLMSLLCLLFFTFIITGASSRENYLCVQGSCDEGWVQYQSAYYGAVMQPKRWPKQRAFCQAYLQNAHLASIHTAEENNFIFILRGKLQDYHSGKAYWIGAHDLFKGVYNEVVSLLAHMDDQDKGKIALRIAFIAETKLAMVLTVLLEKLQKDEQNRVDIYCVLEKVLQQDTQGLERRLLKKIITLASNHMRETQEARNELKVAASNTLVTLARCYFSDVMLELMYHLELPEEFIFITLGNLSSAY